MGIYVRVVERQLRYLTNFFWCRYDKSPTTSCEPRVATFSPWCPMCSPPWNDFGFFFPERISFYWSLFSGKRFPTAYGPPDALTGLRKKRSIQAEVSPFGSKFRSERESLVKRDRERKKEIDGERERVRR